MSNKHILSAGRPSAKKDNSVTLASLTEEETVKRVNFSLPDSIHRELKIYVAKNKTTIQELLANYVKSVINK